MRVSESYGITVRMALFSHFSKSRKLCDDLINHQLRSLQGFFTETNKNDKGKSLTLTP
jgi:hypothetical protein